VIARETSCHRVVFYFKFFEIFWKSLRLRNILKDDLSPRVQNFWILRFTKMERKSPWLERSSAKRPGLWARQSTPIPWSRLKRFTCGKDKGGMYILHPILVGPPPIPGRMTGIGMGDTVPIPGPIMRKIGTMIRRIKFNDSLINFIIRELNNEKDHS
jgi:hypothetical protein